MTGPLELLIANTSLSADVIMSHMAAGTMLGYGSWIAGPSWYRKTKLDLASGGRLGSLRHSAGTDGSTRVRTKELTGSVSVGPPRPSPWLALPSDTAESRFGSVSLVGRTPSEFS